MGTIMSSRFDAALRGAILEDARATLAAAQKDGVVTKRRGHAAVLLGVSLALVVGGLMAQEPTRPVSRVPFGQETIISADSQGVGGGVEELLPPSPAPLADERRSPLATDPLVPKEWLADGTMRSEGVAGEHERAPRRPRVVRGVVEPTPPPSGTVPDASFEPATEELVAEQRPSGGPTVDSAPRAPLLNTGSRFDVVLDLQVQTGGAGAPVSATVVADAAGLQGVVIPAGSRVVGEAIATSADDRVQMVLRALVVDGRTVSLDGLALGADGGFGVPGKVVRKGSRRKAGFGRVVGAVGSALTFGLVGGGGVSGGLVGGTAGELANGVGRDLEGLERSWQRSDKVIRVPAGTRVTVFVRQDLTVPGR